MDRYLLILQGILGPPHRAQVCAEELAQASADAEAADGQEDFDLDAEIEAAQRDDAGPQDAADGAGEAEQQAEGIENYADPVRNAL